MSAWNSLSNRSCYCPGTLEVVASRRRRKKLEKAGALERDGGESRTLNLGSYGALSGWRRHWPDERDVTCAARAAPPKLGTRPFPRRCSTFLCSLARFKKSLASRTGFSRYLLLFDVSLSTSWRGGFSKLWSATCAKHIAYPEVMNVESLSAGGGAEAPPSRRHRQLEISRFPPRKLDLRHFFLSSSISSALLSRTA